VSLYLVLKAAFGMDTASLVAFFFVFGGLLLGFFFGGFLDHICLSPLTSLIENTS